jgi:hypothetical protein
MLRFLRPTAAGWPQDRHRRRRHQPAAALPGQQTVRRIYASATVRARCCEPRRGRPAAPIGGCKRGPGRRSRCEFCVGGERGADRAGDDAEPRHGGGLLIGVMQRPRPKVMCDGRLTAHHMYRGETSEHREVAAAVSWGSGQHVHWRCRGSRVRWRRSWLPVRMPTDHQWVWSGADLSGKRRCWHRKQAKWS